MQPLQWSDRPTLLPFYPHLGKETSDTHLTNLCMWGEERSTWWQVIDNTLLFFVASKTDPHHYWLFGGPFGEKRLASLLPHIDIPLAGIVRAPTRVLSDLLELGWSCQTDPDHADYVYRLSEWAELPGRPFYRQRQVIHKYLREEPWEFLPLYLPHREEVAAFIHQTIENVEEKKASLLLLEHLEQIPYQGYLLRNRGEIEAILIGEPLNPSTWAAHVGKGRGDNGLVVLFHLLAKEIARDYGYINIEQDLGIPGLRTYKQRLHPDHMVVKWRGTV